jgi:hypothetical protein
MRVFSVTSHVNFSNSVHTSQFSDRNWTAFGFQQYDVKLWLLLCWGRCLQWWFRGSSKEVQKGVGWKIYSFLYTLFILFLSRL